MDWDDAYSNAKYIENADAYIFQWIDDASSFREVRMQTSKIDKAYGHHKRQKFDVFAPDVPHKGIFVFIHGGYWKSFDKSYWSHLAKLAVKLGYLVVMPSYRLAPEVNIPKIVEDIAQFIGEIATQYEGGIILSGHSAGAHLACMMGCTDQLEAHVKERITHIVSISGIYDLDPIAKTYMNNDLQLTENIVINNSPVHQNLNIDSQITCIVGADERPEFIRQNGLLMDAWPDANVKELIIPDKHHFNIIEVLLDESYGFFK